MPFLTKMEQKVLAVILILLILGWAVKAWRSAHPDMNEMQKKWTMNYVRAEL